jgi:hypothetical protein
MKDLLTKAREYVAAEAEPDQHYGYPLSEDPRDFHPDPEASEEAEREAHRLACAAAERGEWKGRNRDEEPANSALLDSEGRVLARHSTPWGLGTTTIRNEEAEQLLAEIDHALVTTEASEIDRLTRERDEARAQLAEALAEVAAFQGRPEGGLPGWGPLGGGCYRKAYRRLGRGWFLMVNDRQWYVSGDDAPSATGEADSPRAAMRAAEAEAVRRGWLPEGESNGGKHAR